jgi:predicted nucleic acid-binding protein
MNPMGEDAILFDTAVALHAVGEAGPERDAARALIRSLIRRRARAYASTEMIQEFVHHRLRVTRDRGLATSEARYVMSLVTVLNFDREVLDLSLELIEQTSVRGRDAVHAATALAYGIETIASSDPAFDGIPGLRRVDPLTVTS